MISRDYLLLIVGMALVTYIPRWLPLFVLSQRRMPRWLTDWLDLIPVAILSALIAPALFAVSEPRKLELFRPELLVAIPTFVFALKTRSLGGTVLVGMALFWLAGKVL
jgi:branched-subunit amino acid transport protein